MTDEEQHLRRLSIFHYVVKALDGQPVSQGVQASAPH